MLALIVVGESVNHQYVKTMARVVQLLVSVALATVKMDIVVTRLVLALVKLVIFQQLIEELVIVITRVMIPKVNVMVLAPAEELVMVHVVASIRALQFHVEQRTVII